MYPDNERFNPALVAKQQQEAAMRMASMNGGTMSGTTKQPSEVGSQLAGQEKGLEYLHQTIAQLSQLIEPVLMPDGPTSQGVGASERESIGSGLAAQLRHHNDQLASAIQRIENLIRRIAL